MKSPPPESPPPDVDPIVDATISITSGMVVRHFRIGQKVVALVSSRKCLATTEEPQQVLQQQQKIYGTSPMTVHDCCTGQQIGASTSPSVPTIEDRKPICEAISKTLLATGQQLVVDVSPLILPIAGFIVASMAMEYCLSYVLPNERKIVEETVVVDDPSEYMLPNERKIVVETVVVDDPSEYMLPNEPKIVVETVIVDDPFEHGFWWLEEERNLRPGAGDSWMEPI